jgi:hypothetical protein
MIPQSELPFELSAEMTGTDLARIKKLASALTVAGDIAEIGALQGNCSVVLGRICARHRRHLHCIDTWKPYDDDGLLKVVPNEFKTFWRRICEENLHAVVVPHKGKSDSALRSFADKSLAMVVIDGDHRYDQVVKDIAGWRQKLVVPGGLMVCHDYSWEYHPDVVRAWHHVFHGEPQQRIGIFACEWMK